MIEDPKGLAVALRNAAETLIDHDPVRDLEQAVSDLVDTAVDLVPGATAAGMSRVHKGEVRSSHATDDRVSRLDTLQTELGQGPCITAATDPPDDGILYARDLRGRTDVDRWPGFAPHAADVGFRSLLAVGLWTGRGSHAALNLYAEQPDAFDTDARLVASLFGAQAATLLYGADSAAGLTQALTSRDVIGQAKGILMERFDLDADAAFQQLVRASQDTNVKLVAVAQWLVGEVEQRRRRPEPESATTPAGQTTSGPTRNHA